MNERKDSDYFPDGDTPFPDFEKSKPLRPTTSITDQAWMDRRVEHLGGSIGIVAQWSSRYAKKHGISYRAAFRLAVDHLESDKRLPIV